MEVLQSYISMVDSRLLHHLTGKLAEFIQTFKEHHFVSEEAFIVQLYGKDYDLDKYQHLKQRVIKMLQALALVSASLEGSLVRRNANLCRKNFAIGQKFLKKGERNEGMRLIRQAYKIAIEYDFAYLACELSSILYHNHIYYQPSTYKSNFYAKKVKKYLKDYTAEKEAEHIYFQVVKKKSNINNPEKLKEAIIEVEKMEGESLVYAVYRSSLKVFYGFSLADYPFIKKTCKEVLEVFESKKGVYDAHYQFFLTKKGISHMILREMEDADKSFNLARKYAHVHSFNDHLLRLYKTVNALYSGKYQVAYNLYRQNIKCRFETIRQQFAIIEAYICFLSYLGHLKTSHKFRMGKYLNDTIASQSNKQGENVAILIAELLIYIARDRDKFIDRIEAIKNYTYKHLRGKKTERAKRFIKILCNIPRHNFHPVAINRHLEKHIKYLKERPIRVGDNVTFIEFVPFNDLIEMILASLERKAI